MDISEQVCTATQKYIRVSAAARIAAVDAIIGRKSVEKETLRHPRDYLQGIVAGLISYHHHINITSKVPRADPSHSPHQLHGFLSSPAHAVQLTAKAIRVILKGFCSAKQRSRTISASKDSLCAGLVFQSPDSRPPPHS